MSYELIDEYVAKDLLVKRADERGNEVVCYTKECFFGKDTWDDMTISHRGALYHNGRRVGYPFNKIFNLDEHPSTELATILKRMDNEPYEIMDKSNGHLFIVTVFVNDMGGLEIVHSTKGSLPHEENPLLNRDIEWWNTKFASRFKQYIQEKSPMGAFNGLSLTFMFEAIVEHDPHTLYEKQVELYGENTFVLLGATLADSDIGVIEYQHSTLKEVSDFVGFPLIKFYDKRHLAGCMSQWYAEKDVEGFVVWFDDGFRFKVKTREYWALRMKKDLTPERLVQKFSNTNLDDMLKGLPEEVGREIMYQLETLFFKWYYSFYVKQDQIPERYEPILAMEVTELDEDARKALFTDDELTPEQKHFLSNILNQREFSVLNKSKLRKRFAEHFYANKEMYQGELLKDIIQKSL